MRARLEAIFAPDGPLAAHRGRLETRPGQLTMARAVEQALAESQTLLVEAGTGVGKSFAYLVPALRSGKRVVLSTATIALQEQILQSDLPLVAKALGYQPQVTLLKGRRQYLCRDRFERRTTGTLFAPSVATEALWQWALTTESGDRAELRTVPPPEEWEAIEADADDCLAESCSLYRSCHFFRAREAAREAEIVVVNHALFFLELVVGGILPTFDVAILDEAHQCEQWATRAQTTTLSERSVGRLLRRLQSLYDLPSDRVATIEQRLQPLLLDLRQAPASRYRLIRGIEDRFAERVLDRMLALGSAFLELRDWLVAEGRAQMRTVTGSDEEADRRHASALTTCDAVLHAVDAVHRPFEATSWVEREHAAVSTAPHEIDTLLRERLFIHERSVILTSATLAAGGTFTQIRRQLGIEQARELIVDSPFVYPEQAMLYVAPSSCDPKRDDFVDQAAPLVAEALTIVGGRSFVLCTSYARMQQLWERLAPTLAERGIATKKQGDLPRSQMLGWLRTQSAGALFGTGTFWEGIDTLGAPLSCVVIDRLPFPTPTEPLIAARLEEAKRRGEDGFLTIMLPAAMQRLKQGFGRLIRSRNDRGLLLLLDGRAAGTRYGATILDALPPARRITDLQEVASLIG